MTRSIDPELFRRVMGRFATGVTVVSFVCEGEPAGMTVNAFLSASLNPPLVVVSVRKASRFAEHVREGDRFGISILSEQQRHLGPHFANRPEQEVHVAFTDHVGTPLLDGSLAQLVVRAVDIHPAGDHVLYIARIEHLAHGAEAEPLIFFSGRYKRVQVHAPDARDGEPRNAR